MSLSKRIAQLFRQGLSQLSSKAVSSKNAISKDHFNEEGKGD